MNSFVLNSLNTLPLPSYVSSGTKAPIFGNGGATWTSSTNNSPTNAGYTLKISASSDDSNFNENMQFNFSLSGLPNTGSTNMIWPGSNTYVVFGTTGSTDSINLSASKPPYPKFMFGATDNSWQRVWTYSRLNYWRCRYEGTAGKSGTPGSPNIVIEYTFFNPNSYGGSMVCELLVGSHNRTSGQFMVASTNTNLGTSTLTANNSYVFVGNSTGSIWNVYNNSYVNNSGY